MRANLLVVIGPVPVLHSFESFGEIEALGFRDRGHGHLPAFFDWLWQDGGLVGVRFWTHESAAYVAEEALALGGTATYGGGVDLLFFGGSDHGITSTDDQGFGGLVLTPPTGGLAITFDLSGVSSEALDRLEREPGIAWLPE
jgi:hypothetical protein